jgi:hypothetical protein
MRWELACPAFHDAMRALMCLQSVRKVVFIEFMVKKMSTISFLSDVFMKNNWNGKEVSISFENCYLPFTKPQVLDALGIVEDFSVHSYPSSLPLVRSLSVTVNGNPTNALLSLVSSPQTPFNLSTLESLLVELRSTFQPRYLEQVLNGTRGTLRQLEIICDRFSSEHSSTYAFSLIDEPSSH